MRLRSFLLALLLGGAGLAQAQGYPGKPIHIVVPFAPGGAVDVLARTIGQRLSEQVGQAVIVDNKPGANRNIAPEFVAKSAPDGYTVLIAANGLATNPTFFPNLPFSVARDFAPVAYIGYAPLILVAPASFSATSLGEVIRRAKAEPGKLSYASAGSGTSGHLAAEMLKSVAGIDVLHVPYKGGAPAIVDMLGGRISFMMLDPLQSLPQIKADRLRAIMVGSPKRLPLIPDVPTAAEAGLPGYEATVWWGFLLPSKTAKDIVVRLNEESNRAMADPGVRRKLEDMGTIVAGGTPQQFGDFIRAETDKWAAVIRNANIKSE
ncbi:MAG: tripartite tricarboxylate transporter substrate binding protein [Betaproteobacteria bacterium]|nr:tripartite tricarboxylate transporter substrate binding protein [Betaproteobacteria bacterium]